MNSKFVLAMLAAMLINPGAAAAGWFGPVLTPPELNSDGPFKLVEEYTCEGPGAEPQRVASPRLLTLGNELAARDFLYPDFEVRKAGYTLVVENDFVSLRNASGGVQDLGILSPTRLFGLCKYHSRLSVTSEIYLHGGIKVTLQRELGTKCHKRGWLDRQTSGVAYDRSSHFTLRIEDAGRRIEIYEHNSHAPGYSSLEECLAMKRQDLNGISAVGE